MFNFSRAMRIVTAYAAAVLSTISGVSAQALSDTQYLYTQVISADVTSWDTGFAGVPPTRTVQFTGHVREDGLDVTWDVGYDQYSVSYAIFAGSDEVTGGGGVRYTGMGYCNNDTSPDRICRISAPVGVRIRITNFSFRPAQPSFYHGCEINDQGENFCQDGWASGAFGGFGPEASFATPLVSPIVEPAAVPLDRALKLTWQVGPLPPNVQVTAVTATATPGGSSCTAVNSLTCTIQGLSNRQPYRIKLQPLLRVGFAGATDLSDTVMPLTPGFQAWPVDNVLAVGGSTALRFAQAAAGASIVVTGASKATVICDSAGFASNAFTTAKAGIQKFTATYSVKTGKKTTKYTATTQLYVPSLMGPMLKIKQGKTGKFTLQFMPPGADVLIAFSDGRNLTGTADAAGKATFTPSFNAVGGVMYSVKVAGVQIGTGGLTITK